jgi:hypothetical protein
MYDVRYGNRALETVGTNSGAHPTPQLVRDNAQTSTSTISFIWNDRQKLEIRWPAVGWAGVFSAHRMHDVCGGNKALKTVGTNSGAHPTPTPGTGKCPNKHKLYLIRSG